MVYGIRRFVCNTFFLAVLLAAGYLSYRHLFHGRIVPVLITAVILLLYTLATAAGTHGIQEIQKFEQIRNARGILPEEHPKILLYSTLVPLPLHFCVLLASLIPITTWEVWFITVFPCLFLVLQPMRAVCDAYESLTDKKYRFWILQFSIILTIMLTAQLPVQLFL